jgi:hypothetical protein
LAKAVVVLESAEGKRLIGKAVCALPAVLGAYRSGRLVIAGGTTNGYVAEELTGRKINKAAYTVGVVAGGELCATPADRRLPALIFEGGEPSQRSLGEVLADFGPDDCFIKGANALDLDGNIGILSSNPQGGTIGAAWATVIARGSNFIAPVGLEKLIPSVPEAARISGQRSWQYAWGAPVAVYPISTATIVSELEAVRILTGAQATMIAAGGTGSSQGAVVLALEADDLTSAWELIEQIKGEEPLPSLRQSCRDCQAKCRAREK